MKNNKFNQGQIAIIVLLASAILLTLGLSASKKAITDTKVDTDEEILKDAFNTAESGINNYLNSNSKTYTDSSGGNASVTTSNIGNANSISSEGLVPANTPQLFWLVKHDANGGISSTYYGGDFKIKSSVSFDNVALKIDYFYINASGVYSVNRFGCFNFSNTDFIGFKGDCTNPITITKGTDRPLLVVVTPLGGSTSITISGTSLFPLQGEEITSVGTAGDGVKTQIKTRNVYQIPSFMLESITARNTIE